MAAPDDEACEACGAPTEAQDVDFDDGCWNCGALPEPGDEPVPIASVFGKPIRELKL